MTLPALDPEHVQALGALLAAFGEVEIVDILPHPPAGSPQPESGATPEQVDFPIDSARWESA